MILWIIVIAASVLIDQISKILVAGGMTLYQSIPVVRNFFSLTYIHNYGAAWGILSNHRWIFIVITAAAIIVLPIVLYKYRKLHFLFGFSLSLIIGGAIGNMIDRIFRGYVVDFFEFTFIDFPVFNIADICVTVGAILMFIYFIFFDKVLLTEKKKKGSASLPGEENASDGKDDDHRDA